MVLEGSLLCSRDPATGRYNELLLLLLLLLLLK